MGGLPNALPPEVGWLLFERATHRVPAMAWLEKGKRIPPSSGVPAVVNPLGTHQEVEMFVIGVDPHKGSHTAAVLDTDERIHAEVRVRADRDQRRRLLAWAEPFSPRTWAIEGATGTGALLAQQLVAAGETVLDVPPKLSARARLFDSGSTDKTDPHDARSAAIVALRHSRLRPVAGEDHVAILRLLAKRHHDLTRGAASHTATR